MIFIHPKDLHERQEKIRERISLSSGMLVWCGEPGILLVGPNRNIKQKNRIYERILKIHDRLACVTRGSTVDASQLWSPAIDMADMKSAQTSPTNIEISDIAQLVGIILGANYNNGATAHNAPLHAEILLVRIAGKATDDELLHIKYTGKIEQVPTVQYIGPTSLRKKGSTENVEESEEKEAEIRSELENIYNPDIASKDILELILSTNLLNRLLFSDKIIKHTEIVFLDRKKVLEKKFEDVYIPLTI